MSLARRFWRWLIGTPGEANPMCPECHGFGFDAGGAVCLCVTNHEDGSEL